MGELDLEGVGCWVRRSELSVRVEPVTSLSLIKITKSLIYWDSCSEFFRSHDPLDWTTLIFEWQENKQIQVTSQNKGHPRKSETSSVPHRQDLPWLQWLLKYLSWVQEFLWWVEFEYKDYVVHKTLVWSSLAHSNSILINDRLVSLTHTTRSSSFNPQLVLSLVHPSVSRVLVQVVGTVGTVERVFFVYWVLLIVLVHDILDRGFVRKLVDHHRNHVSEDVWVKINFWKLSRPWENLVHIGLNCQVTRSLLENNKMQGE